MSLVNFYKIVCNDSGLIYVGSTIQPIERRLKHHEYDYKRYLENKYHFVTSFTIIEKNNYTIHLIDSVECVDRKQRDMIEALYILNENCVNRNQPGRDDKQYRQDNKEKRKQYLQDNKEKIKEYRQDNKEKIKEYQQQYRQDNKEKIKEQIKQYRQDNKEKIKEQRRQYREDNKEQQNEKFTCPCNGKYTHVHKLRHMRSKKHIDYLATL
jgi:DNA repair exonuclease SbcCD ATPase subunit